MLFDSKFHLICLVHIVSQYAMEAQENFTCVSILILGIGLDHSRGIECSLGLTSWLWWHICLLHVWPLSIFKIHVFFISNFIWKISTCLQGTEGATLDIICTYRNSPLRPQHKAYVASMWQDNIYVDHCTMEGLSSSRDIQGILADALVSILKHHRVNKVLKWVDNFCLSCFPLVFQMVKVIHHTTILLTSLQYYLLCTLLVSLGTQLMSKDNILHPRWPM